MSTHIVTEQAEHFLWQRIEQSHYQPMRYCIWLKLTGHTKATLLQPSMLVNVFTDTTGMDDFSCYFCEDNDIFILLPMLTQKDIALLQSHIAVLLESPSLGERFMVYELAHDRTSLLVELEAKVSNAKARASQRTTAPEEKPQATPALNRTISSTLVESLPARRANRRQPEILIIEDDIFSCKLVKHTLDSEYIVHTAHNGIQALDQYFAYAPDIVFLDIDLPDVSGQDILKKIIGLDKASFIVMLSGNSSKDNVLQAVQQGAKGFIGKPFTREKLITYIQKYTTDTMGVM